MAKEFKGIALTALGMAQAITADIRKLFGKEVLFEDRLAARSKERLKQELKEADLRRRE